MAYQDKDCNCDGFCGCRDCEPCGCEGMEKDPHCQWCCQHLTPDQEAKWRQEESGWNAPTPEQEAEWRKEIELQAKQTPSRS